MTEPKSRETDWWRVRVRLHALAALACAAALTVGCGQDGREGPTVVRVGITQIIDHPGINAVRQGFLDALKDAGYEEGKNLQITFQNAQGDAQVQQSIAEKFATSDLNLIFSISTPSTQAVLRAVQRAKSNVPIVFGAVTDPVSAGVVKSLDKPVLCTGSSDVWDYQAQLKLLLEIAPKVKTLGVVSNPGESNAAFALEQISNAAKALGLQVVTASVSNTGEVLAAAESISQKVDALYSSADNTVISAVESLVKVARARKIPLLAGELDSVKRGALCTVGTDYRDGVGRPAGELAVRILKGEKAGDIPVVRAQGREIYINLDAAAKMSVTVPAAIIQKAKEAYK